MVNTLYYKQTEWLTNEESSRELITFHFLEPESSKQYSH